MEKIFDTSEKQKKLDPEEIIGKTFSAVRVYPKFCIGCKREFAGTKSEDKCKYCR